MYQRRSLPTDRLGDHWVRVTKRDHGDPGKEVEVALAIGVPDFGARPACNADCGRTEHGHERAFVQTEGVEWVSAH